MNTRLLLTLLLLTMGFSTGAWAQEQDGEGYYLLATVQDWKQFATLVQTTPTANAKMTADIDLGDDQTMVGTSSVPYQGSFDGQGHTLTVNYDMKTYDTAVAPFACVGDATFQNLHVDGSIIQRRCAAGGVAGTIKGNLTVKRCWVSAYMYVQGEGNLQGTIGGIASYCDDAAVKDKKILIEDCLFSGHLGDGYHCGGLMSHVHGSDGLNNSAVLMNCLNLGTCDFPRGSTGTFIRVYVQDDPYTITNCYYKTTWLYEQGTQATTTELADGTTVTALQAGRTETVWVQDSDRNCPMLVIFATSDPDGIESLTPSLPEGEGAIYNLSGQRLSRMRKGLYIVDGKKVAVK